MKVSELTGSELNYWVARAEGLKKGRPNWVAYSTVWAVGGPIIEREGISLIGCVDWTEHPPVIEQYGAVMFAKEPEIKAWGRTHLIAAMRCYVASKFGEEVDDSQAHNVQSR